MVSRNLHVAANIYVTLCMGKNSCYKSDVAHLGVLQLPWCATTSHWNAYNYQWYAPGLLYATGETTALYMARHIDIDCRFEFRCY